MSRKNSKFKIIIKRIVKGDKNALADLVGLYGRLIYVSAKRYCTSEDLAGDVFNSVLFAVWQHAEDITEYDRPEAWLIAVTANLTKNIMKTQWDLIDRETFIEEKGYKDVEAEDAFNFCIKDLSDTEQEILTYKFVQDLSFEDIAHITGKSLSTISSTYYRALKKLKKDINRHKY